jgi:hypothetical protein
LFTSGNLDDFGVPGRRHIVFVSGVEGLVVVGCSGPISLSRGVLVEGSPELFIRGNVSPNGPVKVRLERLAAVMERIRTTRETAARARLIVTT